MKNRIIELPQNYTQFVELTKKSPQRSHEKEYVRHLNRLHKENVINPSIYQFALTPRSSKLLDDETLLTTIKYFFSVGFEIHRNTGFILILAISHPNIYNFFIHKMKLRPADHEHPLRLCKKDKNPEMFQAFVERIAEYSGEGDTIFTYAARVNHLELMKSMFEEQPDLARLNAPDNTGMTPWHYAILEGNQEILSYLESTGVNQEARTYQYENFAYLLFKSKNRSFVQEVLDKNQYNIKERLTESIAPYHPLPIESLIQYGEVSWLVSWLDSTQERPSNLVKIAVKSNRMDMLTILHENYGYPVKDLLVDCFSIEIAEWLKQKGASFFFRSIQDGSEIPNIINAITEKSETMIEWYLQNYAWDFKAYPGDSSRFSILTYLMEHTYFGLIKKYDLLKDKSLFFCERSFMGEIENYVDYITEIYPEKTLEFYEFLSYLQSSLKKHFSSKYPIYGFSGSSQVLLTISLKAGLTSIDEFVNDGIVDGTPAWMTCENRIYFDSMRKKDHFLSFQSLVSDSPQNIKITEEQKLYFSDPYTKEMQEFFKEYRIDVNQRDRNNQSILCRMIRYGAEAHSRIQWFIENTAIDINNLDEKGSTLLHLAAEEGAIEMVQWIIDYKHPKTRKSLLQSGRINFQTNQETPEKYNALDLALIHQHDAIAELLWAGMSEPTKKSYLTAKLKQNHRHILEILQKNDCYGWKPNEAFQEKLSASLKDWLIFAGRISVISKPIATETIALKDVSAAQPEPSDLPRAHEKTVIEAPPTQLAPISYLEILHIIRTDNLYRFKEIKNQSIHDANKHEQLRSISASNKFELFASTLDVGSYRILNQMFRIKAFEEFITTINPDTNYIEILMSYIIKRSNYKALCIFLKYESFQNTLSSRPDILYSLIRLALDSEQKSMVFLLLSHQALQTMVPDIIAQDDNYLFRKASALGYLDLLTFLAQFEVVRTHAASHDNAALRQAGWLLDEESCCFLLSLPSVSDAIRNEGYAFMHRLDPVTDYFLIQLLHRVPEIIEFFHLDQYIPAPVYPSVYVQFIPYSIQSFNIESLEKEIMFAIVNGQLTVLANYLQQYGEIRPEMLKNISRLALVTHQLSVLRWLIEQDYQQSIKKDPDYCFELLSYALCNQFPFEESQYLLDIYLLNGMQKNHESLVKIMLRNKALAHIESLVSRDFDFSTLSRSTKIQLGRYFVNQGLEVHLTWLLERETKDKEQLRLDILHKKTRSIEVSIRDSRDTFFQKADSKAADETGVAIENKQAPFKGNS